MNAPHLDWTAAGRVSDIYRILGHEKRLMLLCLLSLEPRTVSELQGLLRLRQAEVSQLLAPLRLQGLVTYQKIGRSRRYGLSGQVPPDMLRAVAELVLPTQPAAH